jgi:hypothetical protein
MAFEIFQQLTIVGVAFATIRNSRSIRRLVDTLRQQQVGVRGPIRGRTATALFIDDPLPDAD